MTEQGWTIAELNKRFSEGESADQEIFAEQRSNLLLYSGDHYTRRNSSFYRRIRDSKELSQEQKLRLTKNHTQYICDVYVNNIVAPNPGVGFQPKNEKENHDQKAAQLHHAVWRDAHEKYDIDDKIDDWADSFVQIGEAIVKIYFDPTKGPIKAYEQKVSESGEPLFATGYGEETTEQVDPMTGQPNAAAPDMARPVHMGEFCFEEIYGFNLIRPANCKDVRKAPWLAVRKMVECSDLLAQFPDKEALIKPSQDQTYQVFDSSTGGYGTVSNQAYVIEYFVRPCPEYPNGQFFITTKDGILAQDDLPGGIFPIVFQAFRKFSTAPRGRSPIKTMRPYQAEINRSASKTAEHQITLGDDKLLIQNGTKVSSGASLPGVRSVNYTGAEPKILAGRTGEQYVNYTMNQIAEMYQVLGVKEDSEDLPAQLDPYVMLFRSARQKKRFQRYIKRFEKFLINVVKTYISLAKVHLPDDYLVYAIGATEQVNIPEFRKYSDICYEIKVEAQSDDIETKLGKQIVLNHALQYVGAQLKPEDIGKIMRQMPYANFDESFDDMTIDYDNSVNDLLALDRGQKPPVNQYDNHVYSIKRLTARMRKADFQYLPPQVQQAYAQKVDVHQQFEAQNQIAIQRAQQGIIPTGGYLAKVDLYVPDAKDPNKSQRVTLPSEALQWLISNLQAQQAGLAPILDMGQGQQAQMANKFTQMGGAVPRAARNPASPQQAINQQAAQSGETGPAMQVG